VVSTPLKNISQIGNLPQIGVEIKNIWNHHPVNDQAKAFWEDISRIPFHLRWGTRPGEFGRLEFVKANFPNFRTLSNDIPKKISGGPFFGAAALSIALSMFMAKWKGIMTKGILYHLLWGKYVEEIHYEHNNHTIIHHVYSLHNIKIFTYKKHTYTKLHILYIIKPHQAT